VSDLDLEKDLALSQENVAQRRAEVQSCDLAAYLEFLAEIRAFEIETRERRFYDAVFEL